jgi:hypothetical protein
MSRSPLGYDPRDSTPHGKDAGKLDSLQQTDGNVAHLAMPLAQARPLHSRRRENQHRSGETELYAISVYTQIA